MKTLSPLFACAVLLAQPAGLCATEAPVAPAGSGTVTFSRASVVERSPFAVSSRTRKGGSGDALELRGFYGTGSDLQVSLTRPETKESAWITVGDKNAKWVVETADADAGTAEVNFDGLKLHLTLAKAEVPEVGETTRRTGGGRWGGNMSEEGRKAMHDAMRSGFEKARSEHPEWFDGRNLTEQQQNERRAYMRNGWTRAKAAVAAVSQVDAQQMGDPPPFMGGSPRPAATTSTATVTLSSGSNAKGEPNNGGNNASRGTHRNRGNN